MAEIQYITATLDPPQLGVDVGAALDAKVDQMFGEDLPTLAAQMNTLGDSIVAAAADVFPSGASGSTLSIGIGAKTLTFPANKKLVAGEFVTLASAAAPNANRMWGVVTAYSGMSLTVNVLSIWGSGSHSDWLVSLSGPQGPEGGSMLTSPTITGTLSEDSYAITDGASVVIDPANGSRQRWTLGANRTPTTSLANGQSVLLFIDDGAAYSITWSSIGVTWKTNGGAAPTLNTSGYTMILLTKENGVVYGARVGDA